MGRRLPHRRRPGRDGGPRAARRLPQDRVPPHRRRRRRRRSTRPGPSWWPRASRSSPIPTTSGTSRCSGRPSRTPLYGVEVPVVAHELARARQGHRHRHDLHVRRHHRRHVVARAGTRRCGRSSAATGGSCRPPRRASTAERLRGDRRPDRRSRRRSRSSSSCAATGETARRAAPDHRTRSSSTSAASRPLEIVTSRQWYIRNGGRDAELRAELVEARRRDDVAPGPHAAPLRQLGRGAQRRLADQPPALLRRADPGVVPPRRRRRARLRRPARCPTNRGCRSIRRPTCPTGYTSDQRGQPGGFIGDPDIFDTWATSSLTPQIAGQWEDDPDLFARVFPMDMRPQAHDIIRTWLFATVVRSHYEHGCAPWRNAALSGWILDPDRKKMSKSKGNVVTPMDAVRRVRHRRRALLGGLGPTGRRHRVQRGSDEGRAQARQQAAQRHQVRARFRRAADGAGDGSAPTDAVDLSMLAKLDAVIAEATTAFERFDYARALERTEAFFWWFCDDYVELVKGRAYGSRGDDAATSARTALRTALDALQRLFAPILPFAAEEAWSWWHDVERAPRCLAGAARRRRRRGTARPRVRGAGRGAPEPRPRPRRASGRRWPSCACGRRPTGAPPSTPAAPTSPTPARSSRSRCSRATSSAARSSCRPRATVNDTSAATG